MADPVKPLKILVISDDAAGGHRAAGKAVVEALRQFPNTDAQFIDFFDRSPPPRKWAKAKLLGVRLLLKPFTRFWFTRALHSDRIFKAAWALVDHINHWSLLRFRHTGEREKPDIVLSVHMGTNSVSRFWQQNGNLNAPVHSVVTDYVAHGAWNSRNIRRFYVATEEVKQDLRRHGVPEERIRVTGIPVSPALAARDLKPQEVIRKELGLQPDLPVILLMGGSRGDQRYEEILKALDGLRIHAQAVVLCGRNEALRKEIERFARTLSLPVMAKGFQQNMPEWYRAADLVITKPGGLTTTEVLASGKPMILVSPYAGMEEVQVERLTRAGVALYGNTPGEAARLTREVLEKPEIGRSLVEKASKLVNPDAALEIARDLVRSDYCSSQVPVPRHST